MRNRAVDALGASLIEVKRAWTDTRNGLRVVAPVRTVDCPTKRGKSCPRAMCHCAT